MIINEICSFSILSVTSPTSQLILQPFSRFTYVTAHSPTLPLLHLRHSSFSNPSFASPTSQALHLIHLASCPCIGETTARKWFYRFMKDSFDISDTLRSGRPSGFDEVRLNTLMHNDRRQGTRELASVMNCDHSTIVRHCIQWVSFKNRLDVYRQRSPA